MADTANNSTRNHTSSNVANTAATPLAENSDGSQPTPNSVAPQSAAVLSVRGIVLNAADRQPIADATLLVTSAGPDSLLVASTVTNQAGEFEVMLAPGDWNMLAWHEGYKPITQSYKLNKPLVDQEFLLAAGQAGFRVGGTVIWEAVQRSVAGVVVWKSSKQRATGALLNATLSSAAGKLIATKQTRTDRGGGFTFAGELQPGQWDVMVLHPDGASGKQPTPLMITGDKPNLELVIARQMNSTDQQMGRYFFTALCVCVLLLAVFYVGLHRFIPSSTGNTAVVLSLVEQATTQIADLTATQQPISQSESLSITLDAINRSWSVISSTEQSLIAADRNQITQLLAGVENATVRNRAPEAVAYLHTLHQLVTAWPVAYFWQQEPLRFLEVLLWGLAGVLVNLIISIGGYLRWRRFHREGIYQHIAQIITVPMLAVVFVFVLSTVQLTVNIASAGDVRLALTDPRILAAISFLIGVDPWGLWRFAQETSGKITGQPRNP